MRLTHNQFIYNGLVSYWKMEWNSTDSIWWNNWTGTSITYSTANGKIGQWAWFNGTTSNISIANSSNLNITNDISIFCWINAWAQSNTYSAFIEKHYAQSYYFWYWGAKKLSFFYGWTEITTTSDQIVEWTWQHVWVTYNRSSQTWKFYVNWTNVQTFTAFNPTVTWWTTTVLLWKQQTASRWYNGKMDEVGIYNRTLSDNEIAVLYSSWVWTTF